MKKIISILFSAILFVSITSCGDDCCKKPATTTEQQAAPNNNSTAATMYECPMKCEPASDKAGKCGKCKMDLVEVKK
jgi:PBP1b-binding outer membrane lipoprotein LpoB